MLIVEEALPFIPEQTAGGTDQPMEVSRIQKQLSKTGATEFVFEHLEIDLEERCFFQCSSMN